MTLPYLRQKKKLKRRLQLITLSFKLKLNVPAKWVTFLLGNRKVSTR
jgi:hypothetical protein